MIRYIEAVHRLSDTGTVVTHTVHGTSRQGFDAEWRMVDIFTVDGDLISRCEIFDETDLDTARARFGDLNQAAHTGSRTQRVEQTIASLRTSRPETGRP